MIRSLENLEVLKCGNVKKKKGRISKFWKETGLEYVKLKIQISKN